jgi:A/G-specific adenine glycosylase
VKKRPLPEYNAEFSRALAKWFKKDGRDYPWRRTQDPYAILVSEIMLQQTQIATVLGRGYYTRWLERFPDFAALARAEEHEVLKAWEGLGYYRRARNLQKLARVVVDAHDGVFPKALADIEALPGIGRYTAGAITSFAYNTRAPIVDGNIARVLARLFDDSTPIDSPAGIKQNWQRATDLLATASDPRTHNSALMELGQILCRPGVPDCASCPVAQFCAACEPSLLPVKERSTAITEVTERVFFHATDEGVLMEQEEGARRTGLWKLPPLPELPEQPTLIHRSRYTITRYRVELLVHEPPAARHWRALLKLPRMRFVTEGEIHHLPMPSPYRRALDAVLKLRRFALE